MFYVWYDALHQLHHRGPAGTDPERFEQLWGAHHLIAKDILVGPTAFVARHVHGGGHRSGPLSIFVHGYLLMGARSWARR